MQLRGDTGEILCKNRPNMKKWDYAVKSEIYLFTFRLRQIKLPIPAPNVFIFHFPEACHFTIHKNHNGRHFSNVIDEIITKNTLGLIARNLNFHSKNMADQTVITKFEA